MGEKNIVSKDFLSVPERFAQICSQGLFQGRVRLEPEHLQELDPDEILAPEYGKKAGTRGRRRKRRRKSAEKYRDILKLYGGHTLFLVIGIENQQDIHYAMPLRHMLYDTLRYEAQRARIAKTHREKQDLEGAEFVSGFAKTDRLTPVMTLCVYWGSSPWDGPRNLHDMLDISPELAQYKDRIGNYPLNILEVRSIDNLDAYTGDLKAVLGFVRYQEDRDSLLNFVRENQELFQAVSEETLTAISVLANVQGMDKMITQARERKERVDMCKALEDLVEISRKEGMELGIEQGIEQGLKAFVGLCQEFHLNRDEAAARLRAKWTLSQEQIDAALDTYWNS